MRLGIGICTAFAAGILFTFVLLQGTKAQVGPVAAEVPRRVIITAVGDCTLGTDVNFGYEGTLPAVLDQNKGDLSYVFAGVRRITAGDDLTIANLEGTFTNADTRYPKTFAFKGPPVYAKILALGSVEAVNVANNHIYDYYQAGFMDTIQALETEGIAWFGEGTAKVFTVKGVKLGFLGYAFSVDEEQLAKDIAVLKRETDAVIVSFHWGEERSYWPDENQKGLARQAIDSGADLVLGHHPHVLQGMEIYKERLIAYSLGNFAFGGNMNPGDKRTMLLQVKFTFGEGRVTGWEAEIIPASISSVDWVNDYQPTVLSQEERQNFLVWFQGLCPGVALQNGKISGQEAEKGVF